MGLGWCWGRAWKGALRHAGCYVDAQGPDSGPARHMGKHTFSVWPLFLILQAPIMFCELSEFWWVIWLLMWVAPVRCFRVCAGRAVEELRDFSASWLNKRRRNRTLITQPVLAPWSMSLTGQEPGARSVPWTGRVTVIRPVCQDEGRAPPSVFAAVRLSEMGFHSQKNSASFVLALVSSISAGKKEY